MKKVAYYLSIAYYDAPFRLTFSFLLLKLFLFVYITGFGLNSLLPTLGIILTTLSLSLLMGNVFKLIYLFFLDALYSLIFFIQSLYFKYFDDFASMHNLDQIRQIPAIADTVVHMISKEYLFIVDIIFLPLLFINSTQNYNFNLPAKVKTFGILFLIGIYCNFNQLIFSLGTNGGFFRLYYDRPLFVINMGIINYQIADIYYYLATGMKRYVTQDEIRIAKAWRERWNNSVTHNDLTGNGKGMNLIVIQVESLQNFVIGKTYNGLEITPNLNKLAKVGAYFNNIFDQTATGNSSDATLLANSSIYPSRIGASSFLYPQNCFDSLSKVLSENGYTSAAMHAYKSSYWNSDEFERGLGFRYQFYENDYIMTDRVGWGLSDRSFFSQSLEKIKLLPTPSYAFLRTLTTHAPFEQVTAEIDDLSINGIEGQPIGSYLRSMHYVDSAIGEFLQKLSEYHLSSNTLIVIYGDHRARLQNDELKRVGVFDKQENRKVPLIIIIPDGKQIGKRDTIGGLIDVTPTICNILGIDTSDRFFMGKDLAAGNVSYAIFRDGSHVGFINMTSVHEQLMVSDLILEKDMIPLLGKVRKCQK